MKVKTALAVPVAVILIASVLTPLSATGFQSFTKGYLVVTFDDERTGALAYAAPILRNDSIKATMFAYVTGMMGGWPGFLPASDVMRLQQDYGWEIQGHSYSHPDLDKLSQGALQSEIVSSKQQLLTMGFRPVSIFAYPYGSGIDNKTVTDLVKQNYVAARGAFENDSIPVVYGRDYQVSPWCSDGCELPNSFQFGGNTILNSTSEQTAEHWIDETASNRALLILVFHQILSQSPDKYSYLAQDFTQLMSHVAALISKGNLQSLYASEAFQLLYGSSSSLWLNYLVEYSSIAAVGLLATILSLKYYHRRKRTKAPRVS